MIKIQFALKIATSKKKKKIKKNKEKEKLTVMLGALNPTVWNYVISLFEIKKELRIKTMITTHPTWTFHILTCFFMSVITRWSRWIAALFFPFAIDVPSNSKFIAQRFNGCALHNAANSKMTDGWSALTFTIDLT